MRDNSTALLSGIALIGIIGLTGVMCFHTVPAANHDFIVATLASLATALTIGGGKIAADKLTMSSGPNATVQADAPK